MTDFSPGDILFDRTGRVSHSSPTTYVYLSRDMNTGRDQREVYRMASFYGDGADGGWGGAFIVEFWDIDLQHLVKVGRIHHETETNK